MMITWRRLTPPGAVRASAAAARARAKMPPMLGRISTSGMRGLKRFSAAIII
ncbi:MAG: hypothetical protein J7L66_03765 [Anaerolineaceae bacterium]|nr:hypothetical protein [Anaerolineaceae bacterium]